MIRGIGVPQALAGVVIGAVISFLAGLCRADVVQTTDGRRLVGAVTVVGRGLSVGHETVALDDLADVRWNRHVVPAKATCVLVNGTTLAGRVEGIDDHSVRMATGAVGSVPADIARVARICFGPTDAELLGRVPADGHGLLMRDGDFFQGDLVRCDGATVTMTSSLLGENTFSTADRAAGLMLRPMARSDAAWVVRTNDGSILASNALKVAGGAFQLDLTGVGAVAVRASDVVAIRAAGSRVTSLADLVPTAGTATADRTSVGLPARLVGGPVERSVCVLGGMSVTYPLGGTCSAFACQVGVPAGVVPTSGVIWSVQLDGRVVASRGPTTSVDDPTEVCVATAGATTLTLSVAGVTGNAGALILFADPVVAHGRWATTTTSNGSRDKSDP